MKQSTTNKKNEVSAIDNLKKLAKISNSSQISNMLKEIKNAQQSLEAVYRKIADKEQEIEKSKEIAKNLEISNTMSATKKSDAVDENKTSKVFAANNKPQKTYDQNRQGKSFSKSNNKPYNKKPYDKKPYDKKPYDSNKKLFDKKPYDNKPGMKTEAIEKPSAPVVRNKFANKDAKPARNNYNKKQKGYTKKHLLRRGLVEEKGIEERMMVRRLKVKKPKQEQPKVQKVIEHAVITTDNLTVKRLAEAIGKPVNEIVKKLFLLGVMATINSVIDFDTAELVANDLGITLERKVEKSFEEKLQDQMNEILVDKKVNLSTRPPIVTVMGHVDHGKTSLLDSIRETSITSGEAGGITQHIGAYTVSSEKGKITFIDTPGHAAFTEMRARGAKVTDIAILVVAADDGIMPQTVEAINHIKAADVPMIVAINKMDKPTANPDRVKQQLADHEVLAEDWGGDAIIVPVSAHTKEGLDKLLEMISLVAEMKEIKANKDSKAVGTIIEAKLDKGKGPVATIVVQNGTLHIGDTVVSGLASGRIRAMIDENGNHVEKAGPSTPVAVLGFDVVPEAGAVAHAVDEKMSKQLIEERKDKAKLQKIKTGKAVNLDDLFSQVKEGSLQTFNIIIKAGVMGVVEALKQSLVKLQNEEVKVNVVHGAAGAINESDVLLAQASNAVIIGFNVKPDANAKKMAEKTGVDIRFYKIIYNVIDDVEAAMKGMLKPKYQEVVLGHAEVLVLYKISKVGTIAGCMVKDGRISRNSKIRLLRDNVVVADSVIDTLKIQKDDVKEVKSGFECGIKLVNFNDIKEGDIFEAYEDQEIKA